MLHHAAFRGHFDICKILIAEGCDICAVDKFKKTAAHLAIQGGYDEIVTYMLERVHPLKFPRGAKLSLVQVRGATAKATCRPPTQLTSLPLVASHLALPLLA